MVYSLKEKDRDMITNELMFKGKLENVCSGVVTPIAIMKRSLEIVVLIHASKHTQSRKVKGYGH
jgi:hypothetical protein